MVRVKYEYTTRTFTKSMDDIKAMDKMGINGWELVSVILMDSSFCDFYFKRQIIYDLKIESG